jgi:SAM-dependent methyltransferase
VTMNAYSKDFYDAQADGSLYAAGVIVPLLLKHYRPQTVLDVGCGMGAWLKVFRDHGVSDFIGLDGPYIDQSKLFVPVDHFEACDLTAPQTLGRNFDLVCCLEVAEHLSPSAGPALIDYLVDHAPVVLFSAAIPGQPGTNHINCQWQSYWARLFGQRGYSAYDFIRPVIYQRPDIDFWYRQNIVVYACKGISGPPSAASAFDLDRVSPELLHELLAPPKSARLALEDMKRAAGVVYRAATKRISNLCRNFETFGR